MNKEYANHLRRLALLAAMGAVLVISVMTELAARDGIEPFPLPPLTQTAGDAWFNSPPLKPEDLKGKVVLVDFWTFECWNCYRSFPWLKQLEKRFADDDVLFLGIHSPEFAHEHDRARVAAKVKQFGLEHPVMMDNDFAFWNAMGNRAWPAFYLVDRSGQVRYRFYGETHEGDPQARAIEAAIERLLTESPS